MPLTLPSLRTSSLTNSLESWANIQALAWSEASGRITAVIAGASFAGVIQRPLRAEGSAEVLLHGGWRKGWPRGFSYTPGPSKPKAIVLRAGRLAHDGQRHIR